MRRIAYEGSFSLAAVIQSSSRDCANSSRLRSNAIGVFIDTIRRIPADRVLGLEWNRHERADTLGRL